MPDLFAHHRYLRIVANEDVDFVLKKDKSYGASWKLGGGRSAWFMLRRKIDRMLTMMKRPEAPYNSFSVASLDKIIPSDGAGDCTLAGAIVRHLRDAYVSEDIFAAIEAAPSGDDGTILAEIRDLRRYLLLVESEMMAQSVVALPAQVRAPEGQGAADGWRNKDGLE